LFVTQQMGDEAENGGGTPRHAAPDGAGRHPLIDLDRDPTPGVPDHAAPTDGDDEAESAE
jgi:hypothetical protein